MQRLGEKLRALRERRGLSLRQLGIELGMDYSHLGHIENGKRMPSVELLMTFTEYFGVSPNDLLLDDRELPRK